MKLGKTKNQARTWLSFALGVIALWLVSTTMMAKPRVAHAQDDDAVSGNSAATDNSDADTSEDQEPDAAATPPAIAGSWSGTAIDKKHGSGTLSLTITQVTKAVAVTIWEVTFPDDSSAGGTGSGKLSGKALRLILIDPTLGKCTMDVSSKVGVTDDVADEIKGTYTLKKCFSKNSSGSIDLTPAATPTPTP
jgi:hypothetical protein